MRILIIATERSGSTTLMKGIGSLLKIPFVKEPFLPKHLDSTEKDYSLDNVIVKTLIGQQLTKDGHISFLKKLSTEFDKTILLGRHNIKDRYDSFMYARNLKDWHTKYSNTPIAISDIDAYFFNNYIMITNELLLILSNELNINITWYEKLYSNREISYDTIKQFGIEELTNQFNILYDSFLSPKHRYLQEQKLL